MIFIIISPQHCIFIRKKASFTNQDSNDNLLECIITKKYVIHIFNTTEFIPN